MSSGRISADSAVLARFYDAHPINASNILERLRLKGRMDGSLKEADLAEDENIFATDQNHIGGVQFVDALARRVSSFDKQAIAETKRLVDLNSLPSDAEIAPEWDAFVAALGRPAAQARLHALFERGFHKPGDVENRLGHYVGTLGTAEEVAANQG